METMETKLFLNPNSLKPSKDLSTDDLYCFTFHSFIFFSFDSHFISFLLLYLSESHHLKLFTYLGAGRMTPLFSHESLFQFGFMYIKNQSKER